MTLWKPEIILASALRPVAPQPAVTLAGPGVRPEAVRTQIDAARSLLDSLAGAREALDARAAEAHARVDEAGSTGARVSAAMEAYRVEATLDELLTGAWRQVTALMKERGLR